MSSAKAFHAKSRSIQYLRQFIGLALCRGARGRSGVGRTEISDFTLSNGLELVVIPDHRAPVVTHMIWYKVGSADRRQHLRLGAFPQFDVQGTHPTGGFSVVARVSGQENAFTSATTGYYQRAERAAQDRDGIQADHAAGAIADAVVLPERNVILEEWNQRIGTIRAAFGEQIARAISIIPWRPVIGGGRIDGNRDEARFLSPFPNGAAVVIRRRQASRRQAGHYGKSSKSSLARASGRKSRRRWRCAR